LVIEAINFQGETMNFQRLLLICAATVVLSGCGGGGNSAPQISATQPLAAGSYKLTFSAISTARLVTPISGIDIAVKLPVGISVSTITGGGTGQITSTSITPGTAIRSTSLAFGVYSASTRTAYLSMATTQDTYRNGQFLNLIFSVGSNTAVTPNDIYTLNAAYPTYKVVGLDTISHSTVVMTSSVKTLLGVTQ
jgi:hypothetical protein